MRFDAWYSAHMDHLLAHYAWLQAESRRLIEMERASDSEPAREMLRRDICALSVEWVRVASALIEQHKATIAERRTRIDGRR
jgi:hypothetical protein